MKKVIVIGGGASGLMAAYFAAKNGNAVTLIEKNEKLGKKIYITGKGRCNLTNDCPPDIFLQNVVRGGKFLTGAAYGFSSAQTMAFMEEYGLALKVERGNRVFPVSDHASDVTKTLERACKTVNVKIQLNETVKSIILRGEAVSGVRTDVREYPCDCAVVATGGISYPATGSTGDGYRFAREAGHTLISPVPSLVGVELEGGCRRAQGVTLKNVVLTALRNGKVISSRMGEMLFTHYGISGPLVLSLSAEINRIPLTEITLSLDLKPALEEKQLEARLLREFAEHKNEQMKNVMRTLLPSAIISYILMEAGVAPEIRVNTLKREERTKIVSVLKGCPLRPTKLRGFDEAVVTSGGVELKEVNSKTFESKKTSGLYFCGEVLDADAFTGGFNLQIAFSTGYMVGNSIK